uniref:PHD finger protein 21A isoform X4 n=1 Tax=Petromyzon marinus TaxID=7757 RepID=A0AAJ7ST34_PETMA|nr:PHD finger protein 21A isoform X4 [Petromyzon marinus]
MELSGLQEALKKEIQCHQKLVVQMKQDPQNAELKKQLHECQAKITSLSEKQKKVVEQLRKDLLIKQQSASTQKSASTPPVLAAKPISLVKSTIQAAPLAVVTQKAAVAMVTSLSNGQKLALTSSDLPTANPINLQTTASKLLQENVARIPPKASQPQQALSLASSPIKVPQLSSVHRLTGRNPATLTQHVRIVNGQQYKPRSPPPTQHASLAASTALAAAPSASVTAAPPSSAAMPPSSSAAASSAASAAAAAASAASSSSPVGGVTVVASGTQPSKDGTARQTSQTVYRANLSTRILSPRPQVEANPQKVAFLGSLGLVTHEQMEEIQSRRQERKRRTTANPVYSGAMYEPERKRSAVTYLNNPVQTGTRKRGRPPKYASVLAGLVGPPVQALPSPSQPAAPLEQDKAEGGGAPPPCSPSDGPAASPATVSDGDIHEDFCSVCKRSGQLLMCDTCSRVYHLECLEPPLKAIPKGMWICPKCQEQVLRKEDALPWPGTLAIVHSYIAHKAAKEEEKRKLQKRSNELRQERDQLEQKAKMLSTAILKCMEVRNSLLSKQKEVQVGMERYRKLVQLINGVPAKPSKPPAAAAQALQVVASTSSPVIATAATPLLIITTLTPDLTAMGAPVARATSVAVSTSTGILAQIHPPMAPAAQLPHQPHAKH